MPPRSPYGLIQEDLWPNEWLILVTCMLLNCTTRKQVEKVLPEFRERWPTPQDFFKADWTDVGNLIGTLGFARRRTLNLMKMTERYLTGPWSDPRELPGVGEYAARAWEIFCQGELGDTEPKDHALTEYWRWRKYHEQAPTNREGTSEATRARTAMEALEEAVRGRAE